MKRILVLALSVLAIGVHAQTGIVPMNRYETINCDTDDSLSNLTALDGQVARFLWMGLPESPPDMFGVMSAISAPPNTESLEIRVASTSLYGNDIDQAIQVFDFMADRWVTVWNSKVGGSEMNLVSVVVTSPVSVFPPPFVDPDSGMVMTRLIWDGRQTPGTIVDFYDVRAFPGN